MFNEFLAIIFSVDFLIFDLAKIVKPYAVLNNQLAISLGLCSLEISPFFCASTTSELKISMKLLKPDDVNLLIWKSFPEFSTAAFR